MNEGFDPENEDFYNFYCEVDGLSNRNQMNFVGFDDLDISKSSSKPIQHNLTSDCFETKYLLLNEGKSLSEKSEIEINENPIKQISFNDNQNIGFENVLQHKEEEQKIIKNNPKINDNDLNQINNEIKPSNNQNFKVYQLIFKLTGAYLTQSELIYLRKTIFRNIMPRISRDEQRSKIKNIQVFEKYHDKIIPILSNPRIQSMIQNYLMSKKKTFEKMNMVENLYKNCHITNFTKK